MLNIALATEQEQRVSNGLAAIEEQANRETDLYDVGRFDGLIGCEPTQLKEPSYWEGYQIGLRQYWANKKGIELETEF